MGTADSTPGTPFTTSTFASGNPASLPRTVNVALPVIEPTLSRKKPSVDVQLKLDIGRDSKPILAQTIETTRTCLQAIAARIAMPVAKEDTWYGVSFYVIAP